MSNISKSVEISKAYEIALKIESNQKCSIGEIYELEKVIELISNEKYSVDPKNKEFLEKIKTQYNNIKDSIFTSLEGSNIELNSFARKNLLYKRAGKKLAFLEKVKKIKDSAENLMNKTFVSEYSHASLIYKDKDEKKLKNAEIYNKHSNADLKLKTIMYSDHFRINVERLISKEYVDKIKSTDYNINDEFNKIMKNLVFNYKKFENIENSRIKRFLAGLADYFILSFHKVWFRRDRSKLYNTYDKGTIKEDKICSEFAAELIDSALFKLNKDLCEKLGCLESENVIKSPFGDYENMSRIHPQRLLNLLDKAECVEKINPPKELRKIIDFADDIDIDKASYRKVNSLFKQAIRQKDEYLLEKFFDSKESTSILAKLSKDSINYACEIAKKDGDLELTKKLEEKFPQKDATENLQYTFRKSELMKKLQGKFLGSKKNQRQI